MSTLDSHAHSVVVQRRHRFDRTRATCECQPAWWAWRLPTLICATRLNPARCRLLDSPTPKLYSKVPRADCWHDLRSSHFEKNLMGLVSWAFGFGVFRFGWKTGG